MIQKWIFNPVGVACNLGCRYCQTAFRHQRPRDPHLIDLDSLGTVFAKMRDASGKKVYVHWHGGEPLLAGKDFYHRVFRLEAETFAPDTEVFNSMTTNGLLLDEDWLATFRDHRLHLAISLDGATYEHNSYRFNSTREYEQVLRNVRLVRQRNIPLDISLAVHDRNSRAAGSIGRWFAKLGISRLRVLPCVHLNQEGRQAEPGVGPKEFGRFLVELFEVWGELAAPFQVAAFDVVFHGIRTGRFPACYLRSRCGTVHIENDASVYGSCSVTSDATYLGNMVRDPVETLVPNFEKMTAAGVGLDEVRKAILEGADIPSRKRGPAICCCLDRDRGSYMFLESYRMLAERILQCLRTEEV